jgi:5-methylcytosine-specific restriction endonuclease McrA
MTETRTYADRREQIKRAVAKRRKRIKAMAVQYRGGKCMICGYDKCVDALSFHHVNPSKKEFGLGLGGLTRAWSRVKREADKCVLICANCHREVHAGVTQLPQVIVVE